MSKGQYFNAHWPSREPADQEIVETFFFFFFFRRKALDSGVLSSLLGVGDRDDFLISVFFF